MSLPDIKCETCSHYYCEAIGDYGSPPYEIGCRLYDKNPETFASVSSIITDPVEHNDFPFQDAPPCYEPNFWCTDFANDMDGSQESLNVAYERFRAFLDQGHPL